jgi:hypothetical protein
MEQAQFYACPFCSTLEAKGATFFVIIFGK